MKKLLLATTALVAFAGIGSASAADLPVKAPPMAPVAAPVFSWTGFYIGGHLGYGWQHWETDTFNSAGVLLDSTSGQRQGVFGGGQIGVNYMVAPQFLIGLEADISASDIKGSFSACTATGCATSDTKVDDFGTIRGRVGYALDRVLFYGTGGWAWSHSQTDRRIDCVVAGGGICPGGPSPSPLTGMVASASGSQNGWTAGAGIEWAFAQNWTFKVEYLHLQFDNVVRDFNYPNFPTAFRHNVSDNSTDTIRVGVNWLFNFGGPVVARY